MSRSARSQRNSSRRALEAEREAAQQLRALDEMKNTFLQAVSHDLGRRSPRSWAWPSPWSATTCELEADDARDLARRIAENARKLDRLVADLLDMDRLARGIVSPKLESVDVGEVVRRVVAGADLIDASLLTIDIDRVVIPVDAPKVERIVENLLANTARHTPSNARVWVSVRAHDGGVLIKVEDDGVGVPAEIRETIFEPFRQGPDARSTHPASAWGSRWFGDSPSCTVGARGSRIETAAGRRSRCSSRDVQPVAADA